MMIEDEKSIFLLALCSFSCYVSYFHKAAVAVMTVSGHKIDRLNGS